MPFRPCQLCLVLQDDSVFADFDIDDAGRLFLVRISFDGYGCCEPAWVGPAMAMSVDDSRGLLGMAQRGELGDPRAAAILRGYFVACGDAVWRDALRVHGLI